MTYHQAPDIQRISRLERWAQKHKRGIRTLAEYALIAFALMIAALFFFPNEARTAPQAVITHRAASTAAPAPKASQEPKSQAPDPCGLKDVVCPGEKSVIKATVTTYQAVPAQTDSTPCVGAMAGVDFCNPMGNIVANNCLPLGSYVAIRGDSYYVADRMNPRYGCDVFDVLTDGENYTLKNEPVEVL